MWSLHHCHRHRRHHFDGRPLRVKSLIQLLDIANDLDRNLTTSTIMTIVPGIICVGGVFFFHFGLLTSIILYNAALALSVSNADIQITPHFFAKPRRKKK